MFLPLLLILTLLTPPSPPASEPATFVYLPLPAAGRPAVLPGEQLEVRAELYATVDVTSTATLTVTLDPRLEVLVVVGWTEGLTCAGPAPIVCTAEVRRFRPMQVSIVAQVRTEALPCWPLEIAAEAVVADLAPAEVTRTVTMEGACTWVPYGGVT